MLKTTERLARASGWLGLLGALAMTCAPSAAAPLSARQTVAAAPGHFVGSLPSGTTVSIVVALPGRRQYELPGLIAAQNTPASPLFHHYLTSQQFGSYFGAEPEQLARVVQLLQTRGFSVDWIAANRREVDAHAPATAVEALFGTVLDVRADRGSMFYAPRYAPALPGALRGASVYGLDSYPRLRPHFRRSPNSRIGGRKGWDPADIQSVYDLSPIYSTSTGKGVTVVDATVGLARKADFDAFTAEFGLDAQLLSTTVGTKAPPDRNGESTLDVEWIAAVAPGVTVEQVSPAGASDKDFDELYSYIVNDLSSVHIVTTSWGACEQQWGPGFGFDESLFEQAYTEGQWWLSASGDDGSDDCTNGKKSVDFPGSSPYVVSVGGTEVTPASKAHGAYRGWKSEITWSVKGDGASGGGASAVFPKPAFQQDLTPGDGARDVPDVALMADDSDPNGGYLIYFEGRWQNGWGGTSFAAPMWAGFFSLIAQAKGGTLASPLSRLYELAKSQQYDSLFHDITSGCNSFHNVPGYCAGPAYDQTTGLGSFTGASLAGAF